MSEKYFKCTCAHCGGHLEYPPEGIGQTIPCPHCAQPTELSLEVPDIPSAYSGRSLKWAVAGIIVLLIGILGVIGAFSVARSFREKASVRRSMAVQAPRARKPAPVAVVLPILNECAISPVVIERSPGSTVLHASGQLENKTDRQRFGVTVELELFDAAGNSIGAARDYLPILEPRAFWKFRALLVTGGVASARVVNVREQQ